MGWYREHSGYMFIVTIFMPFNGNHYALEVSLLLVTALTNHIQAGRKNMVQVPLAKECQLVGPRKRAFSAVMPFL